MASTHKSPKAKLASVTTASSKRVTKPRRVSAQQLEGLTKSSKTQPASSSQAAKEKDNAMTGEEQKTLQALLKKNKLMGKDVERQKQESKWI